MQRHLLIALHVVLELPALAGRRRAAGARRHLLPSFRTTCWLPQRNRLLAIWDPPSLFRANERKRGTMYNLYMLLLVDPVELCSVSDTHACRSGVTGQPGLTRRKSIWKGQQISRHTHHYLRYALFDRTTTAGQSCNEKLPLPLGTPVRLLTHESSIRTAITAH